jgi:hypothetical protein
MNKDLIWALILGLTFAGLFFTAISIFVVPGFFEKLWRRLTKPLGITIVLGWALLAMAAVTQIDLTTQVKNVLPGANGGTGSSFVSFTGPTAARSFTVPDANATLLTDHAAVTVAQGGIGVQTLGAHGSLIGEGTGAVVSATTSSTGLCWMSNGSSADPSWQTCPGGTITWHQEAPTGTINGANTTFTLSATPAAAAGVACFLNGVQQQQGAGNDYTISSSTLTYLTAPPTGEKLICVYPS